MLQTIVTVLLYNAHVLQREKNECFFQYQLT